MICTTLLLVIFTYTFWHQQKKKLQNKFRMIQQIWTMYLHIFSTCTSDFIRISLGINLYLSVFCFAFKKNLIFYMWNCVCVEDYEPLRCFITPRTPAMHLAYTKQLLIVYELYKQNGLGGARVIYVENFFATFMNYYYCFVYNIRINFQRKKKSNAIHGIPIQFFYVWIFRLHKIKYNYLIWIALFSARVVSICQKLFLNWEIGSKVPRIYNTRYFSP